MVGQYWNWFGPPRTYHHTGMVSTWCGPRAGRAGCCRAAHAAVGLHREHDFSVKAQLVVLRKRALVPCARSGPRVAGGRPRHTACRSRR